MRSVSRHSRGFTFIELMLVVAILGVLAAMGLPLFAAVRNDAKRTAAETSVHELQKAIQLYKLQTGELPDLITDWKPLMQKKVVGNTTFGPWINQLPTNPLAPAHPSKVIDGTGEVFTDQAAFVYDYAGGEGTGRLDIALRPSK